MHCAGRSLSITMRQKRREQPEGSLVHRRRRIQLGRVFSPRGCDTRSAKPTRNFRKSPYTVSTAEGGIDLTENLAGLCSSCHEKQHAKLFARKKNAKRGQKKGMRRSRFSARRPHTSAKAPWRGSEENMYIHVLDGSQRRLGLRHVSRKNRRTMQRTSRRTKRAFGRSPRQQAYCRPHKVKQFRHDGAGEQACAKITFAVKIPVQTAPSLLFACRRTGFAPA